jgi:hypothetical protein
MRDGYVARHLMPYFAAAFILDMLAFVAQVGILVHGKFLKLGMLLGLGWLPSMAWHGINCFFAMMFAA